MRTIPMLDTVKDAFEMIWEEQKENDWTDAEIDGMTGFVFCNRYGNIMNLHYGWYPAPRRRC